MKKRNIKIGQIHFVILLAFVMIMLMSIELQYQANKQHAQTACSMIVDQLDDVIAETAKNVDTMMDTLKNEYLMRAKLLATLLDDTQMSEAEYASIAQKAGIDEIHIFSPEGVIINGSESKYYGLDLDAGEQMQYFKPMLQDTGMSMCQDVMPNTAEGKQMMYAMVWNEAGTQLIEIGITPERLLKQMQDSDISNLIKHMPVLSGMTIVVVDADTHMVAGSTDSGLRGSALKEEELDFHASKDYEKQHRVVKMQGQWQYVTWEKCGKYDLVVAYAVKAANRNFVYPIVFVFLSLLVAFFVVCFVTGHAIEAMFKNEQDLLEAKEAAERASAAKAGFLSRMSHDIRTPLNGIVGLIEINQNHIDDTELIRANLQKEKVAADYLLALINDVLEYNKMDVQNVQLAHEAFNVLELAEDILTITMVRAAESGITIYHEDCAQKMQCPYVFGSPLHVRQIFINIIGNAIKYNKPGGSITCKTSGGIREDGRVWYTVEVSDTGIGMSREFLEHIYEPFAQENTDPVSTYEGTGLGMAIVGQLVEKMGGTIDIQSEKGVGSTFTVTIPFDIATKEDVPKLKPVDALHALAGIRILLVEDNALNMEIAQFLLQDAGAEVTSAYNGDEAVSCYESMPEHTFDVILTDIMMPGMDGYALARRIRESAKPDAKTIPIIAMTANAFAEDKEKAIDAGMNDHIAKPLDVSQMIATIVKYVS